MEAHSQAMEAHPRAMEAHPLTIAIYLQLEPQRLTLKPPWKLPQKPWMISGEPPWSRGVSHGPQSVQSSLKSNFIFINVTPPPVRLSGSSDTKLIGQHKISACFQHLPERRCFISTKNQRSLRKIQKPASALIKAKIHKFSSTFSKSISEDSPFNIRISAKKWKNGFTTQNCNERHTNTHVISSSIFSLPLTQPPQLFEHFLSINLNRQAKSIKT